MLDGLDDESLDSPVEENSSPQFSRSAFVATPSGTPKSDHQVQKRALHETKAKLDCARKDLALKDQAAIAANDMLYDLRAKLSEVSSAAKKRQADAAAREASLEESLQLPQQWLAEEKKLIRAPWLRFAFGDRAPAVRLKSEETREMPRDRNTTVDAQYRRGRATPEPRPRRHTARRAGPAAGRDWRFARRSRDAEVNFPRHMTLMIRER